MISLFLNSTLHIYTNLYLYASYAVNNSKQQETAAIKAHAMRSNRLIAIIFPVCIQSLFNVRNVFQALNNTKTGQDFGNNALNISS